MTDCMFKGHIETYLICTYYFACKARGEIERPVEKKDSTINKMR